MVLGTLADVLYVQMPRNQKLAPYSSANGHSNQDEHLPLIPATSAREEGELGNMMIMMMMMMMMMTTTTTTTTTLPPRIDPEICNTADDDDDDDDDDGDDDDDDVIASKSRSRNLQYV